MAASLPPCPDSPNCVSSQAEDRLHRVAPLSFTGDPDAAMDALRRVLEALPRVEVVASGPESLRAVFTTRLLRFRDDLEFALDRDAGVIHVRSASRVGYSDLGTNRRRVERLRRLFARQPAGPERRGTGNHR
ncbi:MAG TPA: DUF1499 domain-containing protein [Gammaproteobacteria bacterium]|nr:DUF1499 domain-containing protein [Gammaproteobacteria bacterium]